MSISAYRTLDAFFRVQCRVSQNSIFLVFRYEENICELTFGSSLDISTEIASGLKKKHFREGSRALFFANVSCSSVLTLMAIQLLGGVDFCCDPDTDEEAVFWLIKKSRTEIVFSDRLGLLENIKEKNPHVKVVYLSWEDNPKNSTVTYLSQIRSKEDKQKNLAEQGSHHRLADDPASVLFAKKEVKDQYPLGTVLTHRGILANLTAFAMVFTSPQKERILLNQPLSHPSTRLMIYWCMYVGSSLCFAEKTLDEMDFQALRPTKAVLTAGQYNHFFSDLCSRYVCTKARPIQHLLFKAYLRSRVVLDSLRSRTADWTGFLRLPMFFMSSLILLISGTLRILSSFCLSSEAKSFFGESLHTIFLTEGMITRECSSMRRILGMNLLRAFWLTESSHIISCQSLSFESHLEDTLSLKYYPVGKLLHGVELKILSPNKEDITDILYAEGDLLVRSNSVMKGYFDEPEATEKVLKPSGWLHTGKRGRIGPKGELQIFL